MEKIQITDGLGFIGPVAIRLTPKNANYPQNAKDSGIDTNKLTYAGNLKSVQSIKCNNGYTFRWMDICNKQEVIRVFSECNLNLVMHLAA